MQQFKNKQRGVSLIELMIALGLGIIIIFGATSSLSTMISSSRIQMSSSDMQQTADRALSYIAYRLRNTLSTSCDHFSRLHEDNKLSIKELSGTVGSETIIADKPKGSANDVETIKKLLTGEGATFIPYNRSRSASSTSTPPSPSSPAEKETVERFLTQGIAVNQNKRKIAGKAYDNDELIIINTHGRAFIKNETGVKTDTIELQEKFPDPDSVVGNNTLYAITNCEYMDVFRGTIENKTITVSPKKMKFSENYRAQDSSMVSRLEVSEIRIDSDGYLLNETLFKKGDNDKLMPDVELMRIFFVIADKDGNTKYITAKELKDMDKQDKVLSAEIFLVIKDGSPESNAVSADTSLKIPKSNIKKIKGDIYDNVDTITFDDNVMRRLFVRSVTFRNNAPL